MRAIFFSPSLVYPGAEIEPHGDAWSASLFRVEHVGNLRILPIESSLHVKHTRLSIVIYRRRGHVK